MSWIPWVIVGLAVAGLVGVLLAALGTLRELAAALRTLQVRSRDVAMLEPALARLREQADQLQQPLEQAQRRAAHLAARGGPPAG